MSIVAQGTLVTFCDFEDRNSPQDDIQRLSLNYQYVVEIRFFLGFFFLVFVLFCSWGCFGVLFSLGFIGVFFRLCYVRSTIFRLYGDVNVVGKEAARIRPVLGTSMHPQQGENTCCQFFVVSFEAKDQKDRQSKHCQV